jgi:3-hydroxyacyl-CoA dehydrogenase
VLAVDLHEKGLANGLGAIEKSLKKAAERKVAKAGMSEADADEEMTNTLERISGSTDLGHVTDKADLVIEAIVEDLNVKLPFFKQLGLACKPDAIIATNTSSFSVGEMAEASGVPERVCGLHYFNPVQMMKLVEIIHTEQTTPDVLASVNEFVVQTGKTPVSCGDTPGFIVNRLLIPYLFQGLAMLARGDATAEDIDTAMRLGAGHPMGPIMLNDYVGADITLAAMQGWIRKYPSDPAFSCPQGLQLLEHMVEENMLGRKTGQGFYRWEGNKCLGR